MDDEYREMLDHHRSNRNQIEMAELRIFRFFFRNPERCGDKVREKCGSHWLDLWRGGLLR